MPDRSRYENTLLATKEGWISRKTRTLDRADINGVEVITEERRYGTIDPDLLSADHDDSTPSATSSNWSQEDE